MIPCSVNFAMGEEMPKDMSDGLELIMRFFDKVTSPEFFSCHYPWTMFDTKFKINLTCK